MAGIKRALISMSDKTALVDLAKGLAALGAEILSTGGTAKALRVVAPRTFGFDFDYCPIEKL